jgi:hypothetical protein
MRRLRGRLDALDAYWDPYHAPLGTDELDQKGYFSPIGCDPLEPKLCVIKVSFLDPVDWTDALLTLAHEGGHFRSFRDCLHPVRYTAAVSRYRKRKRIAARHKEMVLDEERRAWTYAVELLHELGFDDWLAFSKAKRAALATYEAMVTLSGRLEAAPDQ